MNFLKKGFTLIRTIRKSLIIVQQGFTLIELLVVISIIGVLIGLSVFGLQGARQSSRDARRKADLESIRSGLEIYKADCDTYPAALVSGGSLIGTKTTGSCSTNNTYISQVPSDPVPSTSSYAYKATSTDGGLTYTTYTLCAALEQAPSPLPDVSACGSCTATCNYKVSNP